MKEYRVKVTVRNNLILKSIENTGAKSVSEFCRNNALSESKVHALIAMRTKPITDDGEFCVSAKEIMEVLGACPTDLWTAEQLNLKKTIRLMEVARSKAADIGKAFVIAICDASGDLLSLERMDGALLVSIAVAHDKARSAVRIQLDTKDIAPLAQPGASLYGIQNGVEPMCIFGGGRLLRHKGQIVGGVGVSGGSVEEDLSVADAVVDFFETTI